MATAPPPTDSPATASQFPNVTEALRDRHFHVYVATPCYSCQMTARFAMSLIRLHALFIQNGYTLSIDLMGNESLIPRGRNVLCGRFLKSAASHLLFIDSDIGFDPATVLRMLVHDKDVVAAIYPKKHIDWATVRAKIQAGEETEAIHSMGLDYNLNIMSDKVTSADIVNGFARVLDVPTGMMLISRPALERVCDAYKDTLQCINDIPGSRDVVPEYVAVFDCMIDPETRRYLSEDYAFCRRAQTVGIEIWADLASPLTHTGSMIFDGNIASRFVPTYIQ
jgi:hypothetical protein